MELSAVLIALVSAASGFVLRNHLSARVGRVLFGVGLSALFMGFAAFALAFAGWFSAWTAAGLALLLFTAGIVLFPASLPLLWRRSGEYRAGR